MATAPRSCDHGLEKNVMCLIKKRDRLRSELGLSEQLNKVLRNLVKETLNSELDCVSSELNKTVAQLNYDEADCLRLEGVLVGEESSNIEDSGDITKHFKVSYPIASHISDQRRNSICKGCKKNFSTVDRKVAEAMRRAYIKHCVKECDKFKELGLIGHCFECKLSFVSKSASSAHINKFHRNRRIKPKWMSKKCFKESAGMSSFDTKVNCKGCRKTFKGRLKEEGSTTVRGEFDYYVHCIEQCEEYKKLNLIRECKECHLKFLGVRALSFHKASAHRQVANVKKRSWMNHSMLVKQHLDEFNTTINCEGCGEVFKAHKVRTTLHAELDYYIHCVEECDEFKKLNLIQQCEKCMKIFLSKAGYIVHAGVCISH